MTTKSDDGGDAAAAASAELARIAAGELAGGVCREMVRPLRELREDLAVLVELLDRHTGEAKGPKALSFNEVESLRQNIADCYLRCRHMARLATELAQAVDTGPHTRGPVDLNKLIEAAITLARHRITEETEVFVDLASLPMVRGSDSDLLLVIARVLCLSADSASGAEGSAISVKTRRDDDSALVLIADNGSGAAGALAETSQLAAELLAQFGGVINGTSEPGHGSAFEIRIPLIR